MSNYDSLWTTPKTDWVKTDYFTATDCTRISSNLIFLYYLGKSLFGDFDLVANLSSTWHDSDFIYADDINGIEANFDVINQHTMNKNYGKSPHYHANGSFIDYVELNRLESAMLDLYEELTNYSGDRRMFVWNFGVPEGME